MARRARPSCVCLCEDLGQAVPPADTPLLDEVPSVPNLGDSEAPFRFFR
jgi:hypothetical protein